MNEVRLIDANALKLDIDLQKGCSVFDIALAVIKSVQEAPTIDAVPVVHAKWEDGMKCPQCGQIDWTKPSYCPNCGAKMDLESEEE